MGKRKKRIIEASKKIMKSNIETPYSEWLYIAFFVVWSLKSSFSLLKVMEWLRERD